MLACCRAKISGYEQTNFMNEIRFQIRHSSPRFIPIFQRVLCLPFIIIIHGVSLFVVYRLPVFLSYFCVFKDLLTILQTFSVKYGEIVPSVPLVKSESNLDILHFGGNVLLHNVKY